MLLLQRQQLALEQGTPLDASQEGDDASGLGDSVASGSATESQLKALPVSEEDEDEEDEDELAAAMEYDEGFAPAGGWARWARLRIAKTGACHSVTNSCTPLTAGICNFIVTFMSTLPHTTCDMVCSGGKPRGELSREEERAIDPRLLGRAPTLENHLLFHETSLKRLVSLELPHPAFTEASPLAEAGGIASPMGRKLKQPGAVYSLKAGANQQKGSGAGGSSAHVLAPREDLTTPQWCVRRLRAYCDIMSHAPAL